ncbi:MAG TPA: YggS family pyridoxal phosphate-dependent enzyme [Tenuifilaceae bacterium]|nr:YggS family pyridoxal phosphate-dependent enzyme [Tenuifilaceae bacterium]HPE18005.1 YggS family pyridoxal phosphate-dependent enzyme [Tenuifilaceae bacterium]HPJ44874.1 YggS family pyridoxal phosphate-dependent enzyme [Tenuifilaceae bacterium]HPQ33159.1 YggS family pyridoxal phosphate-dependent enzyme [Tenuifilaceae bacterium]HRX67093.1 YggS family pyridoxal phosphate-dependent enzyme [Tenuifilaceae bacterium]
MSVATNLQEIKSTLPLNVTLVAISKTHPVEIIMEAYNAGHRIFGENKVQEMVAKYEQLPKDIEWHLVGHLQTNKVKYIAPFVRLIHSVDSFKLLNEINKQAAKNSRVIDCLLQMHIAEEETKFGLSSSELIEILHSNNLKSLQNIRIVGLMGMATFTDNMEQVRKEFKNLKSIFEKMKSDFFSKSDSFSVLSMGMSADYVVAVEEGSTMVRVGSNIFGARSCAIN